MTARTPDAIRRRADGWPALSRLGAGAVLAGLAFQVGGTFARPEGVLAAAVAALVLSLLTGFRPGGRGTAAAALVADLGWITLAVLSAGRADAGLTLFYPLAAFVAGVTVGGRPGTGLAGAAAVGLGATSWWLGAFSGQPGQVALQALLLLVLGIASTRMRATATSRDRALVQATRAIERLKVDTDAIVEHLGSGVLSVDASGRIAHMNRAAAETLGRPASGARGLHLREALLPGGETLVAILEEGLGTGRAVQRRELTVLRGDGPVPLGLGTTILRGRDGETTGVAALFQDLTDVHRQRALERRRDRLAAIGELAAGIAHEIRNSILPVSGSVQLLAQELRPSGEQAKLFEVIERETDNIERFVSSLLSYTRLPSPAPGEVDLDLLVREAAADPRPGRTAEPGIHVEVGGGVAWADAGQLRQVVRNLLANALDAAGEGGTVWLRCGAGDGQRVWIEVEDDGPGVPEGEREAVFRPFYTTKAGGTGLGLAIAARIVEDHDGAITVERGGRGGARFRVALPATAGRADRAAA